MSSASVAHQSPLLASPGGMSLKGGLSWLGVLAAAVANQLAEVTDLDMWPNRFVAHIVVFAGTVSATCILSSALDRKRLSRHIQAIGGRVQGIHWLGRVNHLHTYFIYCGVTALTLMADESDYIESFLDRSGSTRFLSLTGLLFLIGLVLIAVQVKKRCYIVDFRVEEQSIDAPFATSIEGDIVPLTTT